MLAILEPKAAISLSTALISRSPWPGIYARGASESSPITFAILTTEANEIMASVRQPLLLATEWQEHGHAVVQRQNGSSGNAHREATQNGDVIEAESWYRHAEHYFRVMRERTS